MLRKFLTTLVIVSGLSFVYADAPNFDALFKAQVQAAKPSVTVLQNKEVMQMIADQKDFILLDVREKDEIATFGTIEWAKQKNISRGKLEPLLAKSGLTIDDNIIVLCKTGGRAILAGKTLKDYGFKNVSIIDGGMDKWLEDKLPSKD